MMFTDPATLPICNGSVAGDPMITLLVTLGFALWLGFVVGVLWRMP